VKSVSALRSSIVATGLAAVLFGPAFAADPPPPPTPHPPAALAATSLVWCGDVETPRAAPELYEDSPVYRGNQMPADEVRRWARSRPGFVDLWIDRQNNGWINVQFTEGVARRQAELEREFPGVGVVAVKVANSESDLRRLARRVGDFVQERGLQTVYGWGNADNIVQLGLEVVTDELASALEAEFANEPLCVEGPDPEELVQPGPQPLAGDGWVMLGWEQGQGPAFEFGIATDQASYERLWGDTQLDGPPPTVDFGVDVVVWFSEGHGSSCPNLRLDEIIVDRERSQVYPLIVDTDNSLACTSDLVGTYQYVAALDRAELPAGPFEIGLGGGDGELWRSLHVDADLTVPGSVVATDGADL
jgi:hypothetical protein